jgi:hypothetical protein
MLKNLKINYKIYFLFTAFNLYFFSIFNNLPSKYYLEFSFVFIGGIVLNQFCLLLMTHLLFDRQKFTTMAALLGILKFLILAIMFFYIATRFDGIIELAVLTYVFQLLIFVFSIKTYVFKNKDFT